MELWIGTGDLPQHAIPILERSVRNQLQLLGADVARVCLLGRTGNGKTFLINVVLGKELLPALDTGTAVTSCVIEISNDPSLAANVLVFTAAVCSRDEWEEKKIFFVEVLVGGAEIQGARQRRK